MPSQHLFDHRYGKGALDRLRSMLDDPATAYQDIADKYDLTRQRPTKRKKSSGAWMSLRGNMGKRRREIRGAKRFSRN
jgi:hypothetical protein